MDKVKLAKISIFIMTSLIFIGLIILIMGMKTEFRKLKKASGVKTIQIEKDSKIKDISKFNDLILIHTHVNGKDKIIIADPETGNIRHNLEIIEKE